MSDRRLALVTGGAGGIGSAVVATLRAGGTTAYSLDLALGDGSTTGAIRVDVTDPVAVEAAVAEVLTQHGRIDVLVCCAGVKVRGRVDECELAEWRRCQAVNVDGTFHAIRAVLPAMRAAGSGCIVTIASNSAHGDRAAPAYAAAKAAVLALTKSVALDVLGDGIRVNAVVPGYTQTPMATALSSEQAREKIAQNVAGRLNTAQDVADVVAFLVSPAAATMSGAVVDVAHVNGEPVR